MAEDTRRRLIDGAIETVRRNGIAGTSARTVAATAGVNQALVFYHFGSVADLLSEACQTATESDVARYRDRFDAALDRLGVLLEVVDDLRPVAGAAVRRRVARAAGK